MDNEQKVEVAINQMEEIIENNVKLLESSKRYKVTREELLILLHEAYCLGFESCMKGDF